MQISDTLSLDTVLRGELRQYGRDKVDDVMVTGASDGPDAKQDGPNEHDAKEKGERWQLPETDLLAATHAKRSNSFGSRLMLRSAIARGRIP